MKKRSRDTCPRNHCTNFEDYRSIFRHRSEDTFVWTDGQTKFSLQFLSSRGLKRGEKKFQVNRKKKNFRDCSNICPPGLRTYKKA